MALIYAFLHARIYASSVIDVRTYIRTYICDTLFAIDSSQEIQRAFMSFHIELKYSIETLSVCIENYAFINNKNIIILYVILNLYFYSGI